MHKININELKNLLDKGLFISKYIKDKNLNIELVYGSDFKNAKILRDFINIICKELNCSLKEQSRIILIVDELNNNAIEYGTEKDGENTIRVKSINNEDIIELIIEVEDSGKGPKAKKALDMETLRAHQLKLGYEGHNSIRGRGLFMIIVKTVDRLYFKDSKSRGLIVGVKKHIKIKK